jgi:hypothetical protein
MNPFVKNAGTYVSAAMYSIAGCSHNLLSIMSRRYPETKRTDEKEHLTQKHELYQGKEIAVSAWNITERRPDIPSLTRLELRGRDVPCGKPVLHSDRQRGSAIPIGDDAQ